MNENAFVDSFFFRFGLFTTTTKNTTEKIKLEKRFLGAQTGIQVSQEIRLPSPNSPVII